VNELIALAMPPGQGFVDELQRAWDAGDAVLPIDVRLPPLARNLLLDELRPHAVVDENSERFERTGGISAETSDALVVATSGTTGKPKGVVLTHDAVRTSAEITSRWLDVTGEDRWLCCLPVAHIGGLSVITRALLTETELTVSAKFDADEMEAFARAGCTLVSLVTTAMRRIDTNLFRAIVLGAGNLPSTLPANVFASYGMTETGSAVAYNGFALDGVELRIAPNDEIQVRTPTALRAYRDGTDPKTIDGWLPTGDAGALAPDGKLTVHGRIADMINTGGEKVWPAAVETALKQQSGVTEALVFGEPDPEWGQRVMAHIECSTDVDVDELRQMLREMLPSYAVPKEIRAVERLERTAIGKLKRTG
jgi:o-succinylbenzoate---CoA ligase